MTLTSGSDELGTRQLTFHRTDQLTDTALEAVPRGKGHCSSSSSSSHFDL